MSGGYSSRRARAGWEQRRWRSNGDGGERRPVGPQPGGTGDSLFARIRTGEWPIVQIDLSEAYANVRRRGKALRRRRIISSVLAVGRLGRPVTVVGVYYVSTIPLPDALSLPATTTVYYSDGTTVMARLGSQNRIIVDRRDAAAARGQRRGGRRGPGLLG